MDRTDGFTERGFDAVVISRNIKQPANQLKAVAEILRVLIVDDHPLFREGLKELLQGEPNLEICGEAAEESDALAQFRATGADLVTVDISLASGSGIDLVKQIKRTDPKTFVLVLSMHEDRIYALRALNAGALGYVSKQATAEEILRAIRTVRAGRIYLSEDMAQRVLRRNVGSARPQGQSPIDSLSDRELEVFRLIGLGHSTKQIANKLDLAATTIETYRERLKTKLNLASGTELAHQATLWMLQNQ